MARTMLALIVAALLIACGESNAAGPTETPTMVEITPSATRAEQPTATPEPQPAILFVGPAMSGNTVHRVTVTGLGLEDEELPFAVPFAETALSPNGDLLAYVRAGVDPGIVLVDVVHATQRDLAETPVGQVRPIWSIDGERVAVTAARDDGTVILWWDVTSGNSGEVALDVSAVAGLRWLPDGSGFSYITDGQAAVVEPDGEPVPLAADKRYEVLEVAMSLDGERAALVRLERPPTPTPTPDVPATPTPEPTFDPSRTATPTAVASPATPTPGEWSIDIVSRAGQRLAGVAAGFTGISELRWIPALEDQLAFAGTSPQGVTGLWMLQPGTIPTLVYEGRVDDASWSPDGAYVAVVADGGPCGRTCPRGYLRVVEMETGKTFSIARDRVLGAPAWEQPATGP